jgi:hypothetical protein
LGRLTGLKRGGLQVALSMGLKMTAFDLIYSIFSKPGWRGVAPNVRIMTPDQLGLLEKLINEDPERGKMHAGAPGSFVWMPAGKHKYVVTRDLHGTRHMLTRLSNIETSLIGSLF